MGLGKGPLRIILSGATLYWLATSLCTAPSSSKNILILMKGSRPFCVSICQGFGRASRSDTLPCERPSTASPKRRWLMEYWDRISLIRRTVSSVLTWLYRSNCCCVIGGRLFLKMNRIRWLSKLCKPDKSV